LHENQPQTDLSATTNSSHKASEQSVLPSSLISATFEAKAFAARTFGVRVVL
jgi:hypothetical protein